MNNFNFGEMNTPITFYEVKTVSNNGMPAKPEEVEYYSTFAKEESVTIRDYQTAVQNNTQNEITFFIRDYPIDNKMVIKKINDNASYKIKSIQSNYRNSRITIIRTEAVTK